MVSMGNGPQRYLSWSILLLLLFGQLMLYSATAILGVQRHDSEFYFVLRQSLLAAIGLAFMFLFARVRYQFWQKIAPALIAIQVALILATLFSPLRVTAQGVSRWLRLGPVAFQPSELAKISLSFYMAHLLCLQPLSTRENVLRAIPLVILLLAIHAQPDLGTTVLLGAIIFSMLFLAGIRLSYVLSFIGGGALLFLLALTHSSYRTQRILAFLNPWADPQGNGFQTIQSFLSFHSGKIFGTGLGNGNSKLFFLPEVHTDFIFSLIGEELGFLGALTLLLAFCFLSHQLLRIVRYAPDTFSRYLSLGLALSLILQILVNLGGVTGLLPVKGLPLPFLSWGRTALFVNLASIGILMNISRQSCVGAVPLSVSQPSEELKSSI